MAGPKPQDESQWARAVERRLAALERPQVQRIGAWSLFVETDGSLVAVNSTTGNTKVIAP